MHPASYTQFQPGIADNLRRSWVVGLYVTRNDSVTGYEIQLVGPGMLISTEPYRQDREGRKGKRWPTLCSINLRCAWPLTCSKEWYSWTSTNTPCSWSSPSYPCGGHREEIAIRSVARDGITCPWCGYHMTTRKYQRSMNGTVD